ncbi:MAG: TauD/TfdA family dioxygenase [Gammaproteobacteria bacterium]|nr:TauD/TfdA family dioxygenase [Gammaproteobacteria bacterium]
MSLILTEEIVGSGAWKASDFVQDDSWIYHVSDAVIIELENALASVKRCGLNFPNFRKEDFPIDRFRSDLRSFSEDLESGRGFLLLRGLPVERYTEEEVRIIYYGIGLHLGEPVRQNPKGELLGWVMNIGDLDDKNTRVYETNAYLPYHTDPSDVVGLLSLKKAKSGGLSSLVSVSTVYNELLAQYPEYLGIFYRPMRYAHLGEDLPSLSPIFSFHDGKLSCRYLRQYIELGHEIMGLSLSRVEIEALDIFDSIVANKSNRIDMMLEPGDIQFANNYTILHSRSHFEDFDKATQKRKLLRLWLKMPNARKLASDFPGRNGFPLKGDT